MTTPWRACIAAMSVLEVILILHMTIQPWVLPKRKTLTIFMTTPWRAWTPHAPIKIMSMQFPAIVSLDDQILYYSIKISRMK
jgi:hypothetical protein